MQIMVMSQNECYLPYEISLLHNLKIRESKSDAEEQQKVGILGKIKYVYDQFYIDYNNQHLAIKSM